MRLLQRVLLGCAIVVSSFFATLWIIDNYWAGRTGVGRGVGAYPELVVGKSISFAGGQNASALLSGWSVPEPTGVWSDGSEATLGLQITQGPASPVLKFEGQAAIFSSATTQIVRISVGTTRLGEYVLTSPAASFEVPLKSLHLAPGSYRLVFTLDFPLAVQVESRKLGFGLVSVALVG